MKIDESLKKLIEENAMALTTVDENGSPHAIAIGFAKVIDDKIIITDNYMSETPANLKRNNNVALAVWSRNWEDDCKGFELKGTAEYLTSGEWKEFVEKLPENKDYPAKAAIVITVTKIKKLA